MQNEKNKPNYKKRNLVLSLLGAAALGSGCSMPMTRAPERNEDRQSVLKKSDSKSSRYVELEISIQNKLQKYVSRFHKPADDPRVEVISFFKFYCTPCISFEKLLNPWLDSNSSRVFHAKEAAASSPEWESVARLFYAALYLGIPYSAHHKFEKYLRDSSKQEKTPERIAEFLQTIKPDFDKEAYPSVLNSFAVTGSINISNALFGRAKLRSVPSLLVNRKYTVNTAGRSYNDMIDTIEELVTRELA